MDVRRRLGLNVQRLRRAKAGRRRSWQTAPACTARTSLASSERGVRNPTITIVEKLALTLGATIGEVTGS